MKLKIFNRVFTIQIIFLFVANLCVANKSRDTKQDFIGGWDLGEKLVVLFINADENYDALIVKYCQRNFFLKNKKCNNQQEYVFNYSAENNFYYFNDENDYNKMHAWIQKGSTTNTLIYEFKNRWSSDKIIALRLL